MTLVIIGDVIIACPDDEVRNSCNTLVYFDQQHKHQQI